MNCHECNCHTMPPCVACENCAHWDHQSARTTAKHARSTGMTDNRTNVQIVADALRSMPEAERDDDRDPAVVVAEYAVAALVAAQGAAPQAESAESADCDRDRMGICKRCGMGWDARKVLDGDFACPVLPSSGVDEDALAQVIQNAEDKSPHANGWTRKPGQAQHRAARAVAEWLKEQGQ